MEIYAKLGALLILLLMLLFGAEWLDLQWWVVGIGLGLLCFGFIASLPGAATTFNVAWFVLLLSVLIMAAAWLVARFHDIPLSELSSDRFIYRKVRRLPSYAMAALTFSIATFIAASLRRKRPPTRRKGRKG